MNTIYCCNDPCETEAIYVAIVGVTHKPLCATCAEAFEMGMAAGDEAVLIPVEDLDEEICPACPECGNVEDNKGPDDNGSWTCACCGTWFKDDQVIAYAAYDVAMFKGTFGSMGTDSSHRGKHLGVTLLRKCLRDMKQMHYPRCEIAWVGPISFYTGNLGACINRVFREYKKTID